jgi:hypothetical protein
VAESDDEGLKGYLFCLGCKKREELLMLTNLVTAIDIPRQPAILRLWTPRAQANREGE